jgi:hypothetical protein
MFDLTIELDDRLGAVAVVDDPPRARPGADDWMRDAR